MIPADFGAHAISFLGGPAACAFILWWVVTKVNPRRDELFAQALRDVTSAHKSESDAVCAKLERQTARIDRLSEVVVARSQGMSAPAAE